LAICLIMSLFSYSYTREARKSEERLELEHRNTVRALEERNTALVRLNNELSEAAEYVKTMLPEPIAEGGIRTNWSFIPSESLGGDAFGYNWLDPHNFAIYLIDVSGHGVGAALLSVSVVNLLRSQSLPNTDFRDPQQVLAALNIAFPSEENNDMFFTIWYGVYNTSTRDLTYASGGHPPALIFSASDVSGSASAKLKTPNYVIGGMAGSTYVKRQYRVSRNSTLYIFSDGCYEVEKSDGSMWRFDEFSDFMANLKSEARTNLDSLYRYATAMGNTNQLLDDFTILEVAFK
jgi:sigma-B regulation protein RsbU (phosphoserine phosphatase)